MVQPVAEKAANAPRTMKAIVQERYGPPAEVFKLREIERPVPGEGEVVVRVRATTVHPDVWHAVTGRPWVLRLMWAGLRRPADPVPGMDVAGVVEELGPGVTRFAPGDEVFGATRNELTWRNGGAFAEYAAVPAAALATKPPDVSFEEAAAVPMSGFIALLNLRFGRLAGPGTRILINGAGGCVGTLALQLAKSWGARVTGVDNTEKLELLRELGADRVIDYTREELTADDGRYDVVLDIASNLSLRRSRPLLEPGGVYILIGHDQFGAATGRLLGSIPRVMTLYLMSPFLRHLPKRDPGFSMPGMGETMVVLAEHLGAGTLTPVIHRTYPLAEAAEAMRCLVSGEARGRIVITP